MHYRAARHILPVLRPQSIPVANTFNLARTRSASSISNDRLEHLLRTADQPRAQEAPIAARVERIYTENASGSVKSFLFTPAKPLSFRAGQWLDVFCPNTPTVGGFSLISAPQTSDKSFELAIRKAHHPPARYFHEKAEVGSCVMVRQGGSFFYPLEKDVPHDELIMIAGGVGINVFCSMLDYLHQLPPDPALRIKLLYGSKTQELLFINRFKTFAAKMPNLHIQLYLTGTQVSKQPFDVEQRRMTMADIQRAVPKPNSSLVYICSTPAMTDQVEEYFLRKMGMNKSRVITEKWW